MSGGASVGRRREGLLSAVRGGCGRCFQVGGGWGVAAATPVEGRRRRRSGGAVLHPAACGGAAAAAGGPGDVRQRGPVGALVLRRGGLVAWGG